MRYALFAILSLTAPLAAHAAPPQLILEVARFRNLDQVQKGGEIEIAVTVPTQPLTYRQRAPKSFQSSAVVELDILKADGTSAWHETVTLKPPVLNDTTISIKNPLSFLKRVTVPDGTYTLRGKVRDQYKATNVRRRSRLISRMSAPRARTGWRRCACSMATGRWWSMSPR